MKPISILKIFGLASIIAISIVNFNVVINDRQHDHINLTLEKANALADTENGFVEIKAYKSSSSACSPPVEYKTSVSCFSGSELVSCSASDC